MPVLRGEAAQRPFGRHSDHAPADREGGGAERSSDRRRGPQFAGTGSLALLVLIIGNRRYQGSGLARQVSGPAAAVPETAAGEGSGRDKAAAGPAPAAVSAVRGRGGHFFEAGPIRGAEVVQADNLGSGRRSAVQKVQVRS